MDKIWRETFKMWAETKEHKKKIKYSKKIIKKCLNKFEKPYVAFGGGKDSIATLHMTLQEKEDIDVWCWYHGRYLFPKKLQKEVEKIGWQLGIKKGHFIIRTSKQLDHEDARWDYMRWYRSMFGQLHRIARERGWDCVIMGIRREESPQRKVRAKEPFNYTFDPFMPQCYPIHIWSWKDVWAYIVSNDLPYLKSHYDKYSKVYGWDRVRLVTFFDKEFDKIGAPNIDGILMTKYRHIRK